MRTSNKAPKELAPVEDQPSGTLLGGEKMNDIATWTFYMIFLLHRAKYDAWKRLGEMPKEKAMKSYVEELQKIVETMSYTDNVADFYSSIDQLDNVSIEDLQLVAPAAIKKSLSNPGSPLHSRETSPTRIISNASSGEYQNGYNHNSTDTSDDEYIDTVEARLPTLFMNSR